VEVVVLERLGDSPVRELGAERGDLVGLERQPTAEHVLVERRQNGEAAIGHSRGEVTGRVRGLAALELAVQRQGDGPRLGRVAERTDRSAGVGEEQPCSIHVVRDDLHDPVGPAGVQRCGQRGLEGLDGRTRLEPRSLAAGERHPPDA
jgi:hypothetical protein